VVATERLIGWLGPSLEAGPLNEGLASGLRGLVLDGRLVTGTRLPAERELAAALGLARATVTTAYDRLRGEGFGGYRVSEVHVLARGRCARCAGS